MNVLDLLEEMGVRSKRIATTKGGEYHSPCPDSLCEGVDRFCVWPKEGVDGRYWCRKCLRSGDAIQFCRDFMRMDFQSACAKAGRKPTSSLTHMTVPRKEKYIPKVLVPPSKIWSQRASVFVQQSHQYLIEHPYLLNRDKDRGLTQQSILDFQLGWNKSDIFESRKLWGLPDTSSEGGTGILCLPKGIVIPAFRENIPIRVKIRRDNWKPEDEYPKYQIIIGGMTCPIIYGDINKPIILVEAELDAMLTQKFASDICCCIALGGVTIRPDVVIDQVLHKASTVLFALDFDDSGKRAYNFWKSTYAQVTPWPVPKGKSPGDAHAFGVDLRKWICSGINRFQ